MSKPTKYPERIEVAFPDGSRRRIDDVLGIDATLARSGQAIRGGALRRWVLERVELEEAGGAAGSGASPAVVTGGLPPGPMRDLVELAASLLTDPDEAVRARMKAQVLIAQDYRRRRRLAAG